MKFIFSGGKDKQTNIIAKKTAGKASKKTEARQSTVLSKKRVWKISKRQHETKNMNRSQKSSKPVKNSRKISKLKKSASLAAEENGWYKAS